MTQQAADGEAELVTRAARFIRVLATALSAYSAAGPDDDPAVGWASRETLAEHFSREGRIQLESLGAWPNAHENLRRRRDAKRH